MKVVSWNMQQVPVNERFSFWREAVFQTYLPLEPERLSGREFDGDIRSVSGSSLQVSRVRSQPVSIHRTSQGIRTFQDGSFFANLQIRGSAIVEQGGVRALAHEGDIVLVDTNEPFAIHFEERCDLVCVTVPGHDLRRRCQQMSERSPVISGTGQGQLSGAYMKALDSLSDDFDQIDDLAAEQISALLTRAAIGHPAVPLTTHRSNSGSLTRILKFIRDELHNPSLSVKFACHNLNISRSHLFSVMMEANVTFASYVRAERLRRSLEQLRDPRFSDLSISEIALHWGFSDHAAYTRTFTKAYGASPKTFRLR